MFVRAGFGVGARDTDEGSSDGTTKDSSVPPPNLNQAIAPFSLDGIGPAQLPPDLLESANSFEADTAAGIPGSTASERGRDEIIPLPEAPSLCTHAPQTDAGY